MGVIKRDWRGLRAQFPEFRYESFHVDYFDSSIRIVFNFRTSTEIAFHPEVSIQGFRTPPRMIPPGVLDNFAFHLGLVEAMSYWKATCSPTIAVAAGALDEDQISWWNDLLIHGMGEYFFVNGIDFTDPGFVTYESCSTRRFPLLEHVDLDRVLLPIGGGRDSSVTGMIFAQAGLELGCMLLNPTSAASAVVDKIRPAETITIRRRIDPKLLKLNSEGFLNGHTPFSAYLAFLAALCGALYGYRYIVLANEQSSNEGNVEYLGHTINHQYSKSVRFEERFDGYLKQYLSPRLGYFSFLRSVGELQIGKALARFPELYGVIKSCNQNVDIMQWCGKCPKCLSVFVTTYPFSSHEHILQIFGRDFFQDPGTISVLRELAGVDGHKPFECVSTYDEMVAGLQLCISACKNSGRALPPALAMAESQILPQVAHSRPAATLDPIEPAPNRVPEAFHFLLSELY